MAKHQVFGPILAHLLQIPDGRTERQTDENDFIGRWPTNVERPTIETL